MNLQNSTAGQRQDSRLKGRIKNIVNGQKEEILELVLGVAHEWVEDTRKANGCMDGGAEVDDGWVSL